MQVKSQVLLTYSVFTTNFPNKGDIFDKPVELYFQCPFKDSTLEEIMNKDWIYNFFGESSAQSQTIYQRFENPKIAHEEFSSK